MTPITAIPEPLWGGYNPVDLVAPSQPGAWPSAAAAGYYYIDNTHPSATDTSNTYGYPDKPRLTIPETTYSAGSYCEIHGGPYTRTSGDAEHDITCNGTEAAPCWFLGTSNAVRPEIMGVIELSGDYIILQWLESSYDTVNDRANALSIGGDSNYASHVCIRHCASRGDGQYHAGFSSGVVITGTVGNETNNIVLYNVEMLDNNDYTHSLGAEDDNHGLLIGQYTNNVWVLNCDIHNNSGDGMQISGNNSNGEARSQYLYIGGNRIYHNSENAIDIKSSLDVIISRNEIYDYVPSGGSDGTAIVIQQEGGEGCDNIWVLFNHIYDCARGVRSEEAVTNIYVIGNVMHDFTDTYSALYVRTSSASYHLIDNTIARYTTVGWRWDNAVADIRLHGNIFTGRQDASGYEISYDTTPAAASIDYNLYDTDVSFRTRKNSTTYTTLADHRTGTGFDANSVNGDADFIDSASDDFRIASGSAAIGASNEDPAYEAFMTRYGLDIRVDYAGNARPTDDPWSMGAFEFSEAATEGSVLTATTLNVTTISVGS